jgi:hypothetical protein
LFLTQDLARVEEVRARREARVHDDLGDVELLGGRRRLGLLVGDPRRVDERVGARARQERVLRQAADLCGNQHVQDTFNMIQCDERDLVPETSGDRGIESRTDVEF